MSQSAGVNKLTLLLAAVTLALASITAHYARALKVEQQRATRGGGATLETQRTSNAKPGSQTAPAHAANTHAFDSTATAKAAMPRDAKDIAVARAYLERIGDPQHRAWLAERIGRNAREQVQEMAPYLNLSPQEVELAVQAMTEAGLQEQQRALECVIDATCDERAMRAAAAKAAAELLARSLGPEKHARLVTYQQSTTEMLFVWSLRDHMPVRSSLSDEQVAALTMTLADERERFVRAAEQAGEKVVEFYGGSYLGLSLQTAAMPGTPDEQQRRLASAIAYNKRIVERVAGMLDGDAIARLKASQNVVLDAYQRELRKQEIIAAARAATQP